MTSEPEHSAPEEPSNTERGFFVLERSLSPHISVNLHVAKPEICLPLESFYNHTISPQGLYT
ncbi:hypothetical protein WN55_04430 [Dufourea novaeangliae]|uniref:Uncharacterized protein n=1 Tax=Dufourea novaeangliae TaxID=178035 RepID=A0A154PM37_DUFNO|nr:hypothetical protein WN55_04430 [Dufourea novaeangliae]